MPTLLSHPAVPLALGLGLGRQAVPARLLAAGAVASVLPDLDVIAFRFGVPYSAQLGHRGFSHSLMAAALVGLIGAIGHRWLGVRPRTALAFLFAATASHPLLDALTNGGLGVALLWPFSTERFFAPIRPILVAPIQLARFFSPRGTAVLLSELRWVWFPAAMLGGALAWFRRRPARKQASSSDPACACAKEQRTRGTRGAHERAAG